MLGKIISSPNGTTWSESPSPTATTTDFFDIAYGAGLFAMTGFGGIWTSANGIDWSCPDTLPGICITYGDSGFIAAFGAFYRSRDGNTWTRAKDYPFVSQMIHSVTYGPHGYVAVGGLGKGYHSVDGDTWSELGTIISAESPWGITHTPNGYVVVGDSGAIAESEDAISWRQTHCCADAWLGGVASNESRIVVVGEAGTILTRDVVAARVVRPDGQNMVGPGAVSVSFRAGVLRVSAPGVTDRSEIHVRILSANGQTILAREATAGTGDGSWEIAGLRLARGIYTLRIASGDLRAGISRHFTVTGR
jgi:hypothetical protein